MWPSALLGFVVTLRAAQGEQADGVDGASLLQVNTNKGSKCDSAAQFCIAAVETVLACEKEWKGTETKCSKALCNVEEKTDTDLGVEKEDATVMRTMCKRYVRSSLWGKDGWMCRHDVSVPPDERDVFCNQMDNVCDGWAIKFVRKAQGQKGRGDDKNYKEYCKKDFTKTNYDTFAAWPGCTAYNHEFPGFASEGLPGFGDDLVESSFVWAVIDRSRGCSDDHVKMHKLDSKFQSDEKVEFHKCMHKCERNPECRALNFKPKKEGSSKGTCKLLRRACDSSNLDGSREAGKIQSFKVTRVGTALLQTGNASESTIDEAADQLPAELVRRSLLETGSSHDAIDQHLESTTLKKCSEPC